MPSPVRLEEIESLKEEKSNSQKTFAGRIAQIFSKNTDGVSTTSSRSVDLSELHEEASVPESGLVQSEGQFSPPSFEAVMKIIDSREQGDEIPGNLSGGVLLDQLYVKSPSDLNTMLFIPDSAFPRLLAEVQGTTELQLGSWNFDNDCESLKRVLKRVLTYVKSATKLIKAVKGTEDQVYLKADGKVYAVLAGVSTPGVMYGSTFRTELLYCIMPGPELPSREPSSRIVISWRMNFLQSTMMKGMIESGARQGLKDSFWQHANLLSQTIKPVDSKDVASDKQQLSASLQPELLSDWKLACMFLFTFLVLPNTIQGLEFVRLDLPDSISEVIMCSILVLLCKRALGLFSWFRQARSQKGSDHEVKARGDGWLLTVALIEGSNLAAVDLKASRILMWSSPATERRASSVKFQKSDPRRNEILERWIILLWCWTSMFFDFDGPFDEATLFGHIEINFVRTNVADLADVWVPLHGKLAQACQSKLHLRIFLNNRRGKNVVREYLSKMGKK